MKLRHLLTGRKPMTNLDSILKCRDIILLTKVHTVKARLFPVVMYKFESRNIKKAECQRIDAFELWCWRRLLRVPWTARRSNLSILKDIIVYMYHSFPIHLSADGHLGCFHVLAIINSAAMNIGIHVSLSDLVSSMCMPRSGDSLKNWIGMS